MIRQPGVAIGPSVMGRGRASVLELAAEVGAGEILAGFGILVIAEAGSRDVGLQIAVSIIQGIPVAIIGMRINDPIALHASAELETSISRIDMAALPAQPRAVHLSGVGLVAVPDIPSGAAARFQLAAVRQAGGAEKAGAIPDVAASGSDGLVHRHLIHRNDRLQHIVFPSCFCLSSCV